MTTNPRYEILFEPVQIGPVTAPNRFYQVPHCTGMGVQRPHFQAAMRGVKAEGGWGVVCTEYCSIHETSDDVPFPFASLWDESDVRALHKMSSAVHEHGALAGVELWHGGSLISNNQSRKPTFGSESRPHFFDPVQSRKMDAQDIRDFRRWHREAALRAKKAEFDIVYVYLNHNYLMWEFMDPALNHREDEYGGSLDNRLRLARELIEDTKEAVGDSCAVAVRYSLTGNLENGQLVRDDYCEMLERIADLPDLWDITIHDYPTEMGSSRFVKEAAQEQVVSFVKSVSSKPVVGVGRFTSPDTMVRQIKKGILDFVGAARPSIADPFIPTKIREDRLEDIRECIGCNICYAHNSRGAAIRCTQNPTMGEEWRSGWHPEKVPPRHADETVLIVGGGPAGLEAARTLGQRGYTVTLAEAGTELGGRVTRECKLPGLAEWARVRDWRLEQLNKLANVALYLDSDLGANDVLDFEADHVLVATGAKWRADGVGFNRLSPISLADGIRAYTPDDIMAGDLPDGPVILFDDDSYYMSACSALVLRRAGRAVSIISTHSVIGPWTQHTEELSFTNAQLMTEGVALHHNEVVQAFDGNEVISHCLFTGEEKRRPATGLVTVTARQPRDRLFFELADHIEAQGSGPSITRIGDCNAPGIIAHAVYAGHAAARAIGQETQVKKREVSCLHQD
ncbi:FAD-dependent oxidoreductase [Aestuariispira insulae]|uniref:2,4-dienoyl-CoA reductase-like NADH-dependent reductase (Old Yellow Enzyme family) n=1 Tax=Aestuariispira insulae TaxID=1461337 RepID=A0A3D9H650_9PROT|nr:FAD-dependent oxidoreductase [Aestuariispira insulae]RED44641.1 2,4-dienoyl-CoA reductase-like NADH-dependent reductase (Old Yellow Enzyme family) [Aestuariispira insulae]